MPNSSEACAFNAGWLRKHLARVGPAFLFTVLFLPFVTSGFVKVPVVQASGACEKASPSPIGQPPPLTIAVLGNESFLELGEGLSIELDPSLGETFGNRTVYDPDKLRTLPVSLIIKFKNLQDRKNALDRAIALGGIVNMTYTELPMAAVTVPAENVSSLNWDMATSTLFSDVKVRAFLNESVPLIKPPPEWASLEQTAGESINGTGISIAIVDTGINASHPDFYFDNGTSKITFSTSFVPGEDARDYFGHGTHVAGIAAGTGKASGYEFVGVAPGASLYNIKTLDRHGSGYVSWIIAGIESAVEHNASVINLSLGNDVNNDGTDPLSLACDWAIDQGVVVVVAAGNSGPGMFTVGSPACAEEVITVGASTKQDEMAAFSSRGPTYDFRIKPDVVAPGLSITAPASVGSLIWNYLSTYEPTAIVNNYYYTISGTSMATPHVAGVAALLKELHPDWSPERIKAAIMNSAANLNQSSSDQGSGRVNAYSAATIPVLAIDSSLSFGFVSTGEHTLSTTIYNIVDSPQTVEAVGIDTYQTSNLTRWPLVSTDISPPETIPAGGDAEAGVTLTVPSDAPEDYYDGALTLYVSKTAVRVPYSFVYESMITARAVSGNTSVDGIFFAFDLPDASRIILPSEGTSARFLVPAGTYMVHALSTPDSFPFPSKDMFLLSEVVNVEKGSVTEANLSLDAARTISIPNVGFNNKIFSYEDSDRQLWVFFKNLAAAVLISGSGSTTRIHVSDTQEDVYFNTVAYVPGEEYLDIPFQYSSIAGGSRTSDAFYSLSWLLHGVNSTTSTSFAFDQSDVVTYSLKYKSDAPSGSHLGVGYWDFAPGQSFAQSGIYDIFPGVLRNLYVKSVDFESIVAFCLCEYNPLYSAFLNPQSDVNRTVVFMEPPYQTDFTIKSGPGETLCNYTITMNDAPLTKLYGATTVSVRRDGTEVQWNASEHSWTEPATISFPSTLDGTYSINVTRTTGLNLWNRVEALAQFTKPGVDENPPSITHVGVNPSFNSNDSSLHVSFNTSDDVAVQDATLWYSFDYSACWASVNLTRSADCFEASVPLSESVQNVSLRIKVDDDSNNYVQYTISPVSVRGKPLTLSTAPKVTVLFGSWQQVQLSASDPSLNPYAVQAYANDAFVGNFLVIKGSLQWIILSYQDSLVVEELFASFFSKVRLSFVQDVSPVYYQSSTRTTVELVCHITFDQAGIGLDFRGTVLNVDDVEYGISDLPRTFLWSVGSNHTFEYHSPLVVPSGTRQYDWSFTSGVPKLQTGSINVTFPQTLTGNYVTKVLHDVAVTNVTADRAWVYQGGTINVNVTVRNNGALSENFTVTLYSNLTARDVIVAQVLDLQAGESETLQFRWDTTGLPFCYTNYTLTAVATIPADDKPTDNTLSGSNVTVRILGDINGDGKVDIRDIGIAARAFGSHLGEVRWNPDTDVNSDGKVDIRDISMMARHFGQHCL